MAEALSIFRGRAILRACSFAGAGPLTRVLPVSVHGPHVSGARTPTVTVSVAVCPRLSVTVSVKAKAAQATGGRRECGDRRVRVRELDSPTTDAGNAQAIGSRRLAANTMQAIWYTPSLTL